ncbi:zinc finger E-box-binding homeobox 2 isoform X2 [Amia ocellicauda]
MEGQDSHEKNSITASDGTETASPTRCARGRSLSPEPWVGGASGEAGTTPHFIYGRSELPIAEDAMERYDFLKRLRETSHPSSPPEHLTQNGTAVIYPAAPEEDLPPHCWSPGEHGSPEGHETTPGSPDGTRMLLVCPFCQRTYRRDASLREHIKFCHERDGSRLVCPLCGYNTTYRAQMERHMAMHNQAQSKNSTFDQAENRKFKCQQCGKAFKYKHHLKEHVRIHSGEKPYECANCKKRFSHSGSYSSHLSSKKCLSGGSINSSPTSSTLHSPPLVGPKDTVKGLGSPYPFRTQERYLDKQHVEDLISPENLAFLRNRDLSLDMAEFPQHSIFKGATLLPYLHPSSKFEHMLQEMLRRGTYAESGESVPTGGGDRGVRSSRDLSLDGKDLPNRHKPHIERGRVSHQSSEIEEPVLSGVTCRWCTQLFPSAAVLLQHEKYLCKMNREAMEVPEGPRGKEDSPLNFSRHSLRHDGQKSALASGPTTSALPVPNGYSEDRTALPRPRAIHHQLSVAMLSPTLTSRTFWPQPLKDGGSPVPPGSPATLEVTSPPYLDRRRLPSGFASALCLDLSTNSSPTNKAGFSCRTPLTSGSQSEPLDLSLPKPKEEQRTEPSEERSRNGRSPLVEKRERVSPVRGTPPLQREPAYSRASIFGRSVYSAFPLFNTILPAGLGNPGHDNLPGIPLNTAAAENPFLTPMAYMFEPDPESVLKRIQQQRQVIMGETGNQGCLDYLSLMDDGLEGDCGPGRKRLKKTEEGLYACDICDKTFQKSSSLLRHKYEHTGKRPHQCKICKKAFKHKHHLIEHSRLHSGEKPYQCDKCGKRFSHSGSYSQHMNHRYAYCRRDLDPDAAGEELQPETTPLREASTYPEDSLDLGPVPRRAELSLQAAPSYFSGTDFDLGPSSQGEEPGPESTPSYLAGQRVALSSASHRVGFPQRLTPTDESSLTEDGEQASEDSDGQQAPGDGGHRAEHEEKGTDEEGSDSGVPENISCPDAAVTEELGQETPETKEEHKV